MRSRASAPGPLLPAAGRLPIVAALAAIAVMVVLTATRGTPRHAGLLALGVALGVTLYQSGFGFTSAYRRLIVQRDVGGIRAQLLMLAVASVLFAPVLAAGGAFGLAVVPAAAPAGVSVAAGAFLFGIGMQLGNGCGSGTLYALGGGSLRMALTLAAFVAGSFVASLHMGFWQSLPAADDATLGSRVGWPAAVALQLAVLAALAAACARWGRNAQGAVTHAHRLVRGPWPLLAGGVALAVLNLATLLAAGHPWTITWAFTLWGAKAATLAGWNPDSSPFWSADFQRDALERSVLTDTVTVMDIGILLGAWLAAALAGRFVANLSAPPRALVAALAGGLAMGYGARIAYGCNVGAFFSGVASTSLHGWLWILAALPGCWVGVRLRPRFGLPVP